MEITVRFVMPSKRKRDHFQKAYIEQLEWCMRLYYAETGNNHGLLVTSQMIPTKPMTGLKPQQCEPSDPKANVVDHLTAELQSWLR